MRNAKMLLWERNHPSKTDKGNMKNKYLKNEKRRCKY